MVDRFLENTVLCETYYIRPRANTKRGVRFENLLKTFFF